MGQEAYVRRPREEGVNKRGPEGSTECGLAQLMAGRWQWRMVWQRDSRSKESQRRVGEWPELTHSAGQLSQDFHGGAIHEGLLRKSLSS